MNDSSGYLFGQHPHNAIAFGGLTPQGYLLVDGDDLVVPCGPAYPARFELKTGKLKDFKLPAAGRKPGGWFVATPQYVKEAQARRKGIVFDKDVNKDQHEDRVYRTEGQSGVRTSVSIAGKPYQFGKALPGIARPKLEGIHSVLAANGKLFVVTLEGKIHCYGSKKVKPKHHGLTQKPIEAGSERDAAVNRIRSKRGVCLALGIGKGRLIDQLASRSELKFVVVESDPGLVGMFRTLWDKSNLYGSRIAVLHGRLPEWNLPKYFANAIVTEDVASLDSIPMAALFELLRPYGGQLCVSTSVAQHNSIARRVGEAKLARVRVTRTGGLTIITREGALPGATNYTGGWAKSADELARAPLGILWYDDTLGHFKRSPQPSFVDGVMVSYGKKWLEPRSGDGTDYPLNDPILSDVYTGRVLESEEATKLRKTLRKVNPKKHEPSQYRPPKQKHPMKPDPPSPGFRINPLTGKKEKRRFPKSYGCDGGVDYGFVYTMRSGTAAYYDKRTESGTINISGPRSGCTNSVIPANGLLNVPYFYEGCTCSYPLPTGLALVSMPEEYEQWASWLVSHPREIQRVGINFGAPGDRMTRDGTLWLDYPFVGGPSPQVAIKTSPAKPRVFYRHSMWMEGGRGWPWVGASGVANVDSVTVKGLKKAAYTVRLYFAEPRKLKVGQRVFDISVQGKPVRKNFDVVREAGGAMRSVVVELNSINVEGELTVTLDASKGTTMLSGIEIIAEGLPRREVIQYRPETRKPQMSR